MKKKRAGRLRFEPAPNCLLVEDLLILLTTDQALIYICFYSKCVLIAICTICSISIHLRKWDQCSSRKLKTFSNSLYYGTYFQQLTIKIFPHWTNSTNDPIHVWAIGGPSSIIRFNNKKKKSVHVCLQWWGCCSHCPNEPWSEPRYSEWNSDTPGIRTQVTLISRMYTILSRMEEWSRLDIKTKLK